MAGIKRASPGAGDEKHPIGNIELDDAEIKKLNEVQTIIGRVELGIQREEAKRFIPAYEKRRAVVKAIPKFWPIALMNCDEFSMFCQHSADQHALTFLEDVWLVKNEKEPRAYTIEFTFKENPFFSDKVLKKDFEWVPRAELDKAEDANGISEAHLDFDWESDIKASATKINWKESEKALTKQFPREIAEEDDDIPPEAGSFFNFFEIAQDPFGLGPAIAQEVFPDAIDYFMGNKNEDFDEDSDDDSGQEEIDLEKPKTKKQKV